MTVLDFASTEFRVLSGSPLTIGDLAAQARQYAPDLTLFHDEISRRSFLVEPVRLEALLGVLEAPENSPAWETGLPDLLSRGQITVAANRRIGEVLRLAVAGHVAVVIVADERAWPRGVFLPGPLLDALDVPAGPHLNLPHGLDEAAEQAKGRLSTMIAGGYWCEVGPHWVQRCPCDAEKGRHKSGPCTFKRALV